MILIDIKAALDSIEHHLLCSKLEKIGIRRKALDVIESYLRGRRQAVYYGNVISKTKEVVRGVPQGSCLDPILFNLMIHDIQYLKIDATYSCFADDLVIVFRHENEENLLESIKEGIAQIQDYYTKNGLEINMQKSEYIIFNNKHPSTVIHFLDDINMKHETKVKYLGAVLDNKLNMSHHTMHIKDKIEGSLNALRLIRSKSTSLLLTFYFSFIHSHLQGNAFLLIRASTENVKELQILQNSALKIVYKLDRLHSTIDIYKNVATGILPIVGLIYLSILIMTKNAIISNRLGNINLPSIELWKERRSEGMAKIPTAKKNILRNDMICIGPKLYNQMPKSIRDIEDLNRFKRMVKLFFLEKLTYY
ncbi:hypothetical protein PVAND_004178 [Polypedilum vanderplanki]|uniref:Reverse transcriptase domain-containing protein n=1 Tax=Polypedilum vanderplanki TaxID=319348 RepID=A0A9J6BWC7_POLVA|nr:hypothetical protein PVAND_004178 [Polypedilum vanderplanki]